MRVEINEDGKVMLYKTVVEAQTTIDALMQSLSPQACFVTEQLPPNTKAIGIKNNDYSLMIEDEEAIRNIQWSWLADKKAKFPFKLYFPTAYFLVRGKMSPLSVNEVRLAFNPTPITPTQKDIGYLPVPNVKFQNGVGLVCLGNIAIGDKKHFSTGINELISGIWGSGFNRDFFHVDQAPDKVNEFLGKLTKASKLIKDELNECEEKKDDVKAGFIEEYVLEEKDNLSRYIFAWYLLTKTLDISNLREIFTPKKKVAWDKALYDMMTEF